MAINLDDLISTISTATPEQIRILREIVAPITKLQRLQLEATTLGTQVGQGITRANDIVARFANSVQSGDLNAVSPTWDDIVAAFRGN